MFEVEQGFDTAVAAIAALSDEQLPRPRIRQGPPSGVQDREGDAEPAPAARRHPEAAKVFLDPRSSSLDNLLDAPVCTLAALTWPPASVRASRGLRRTKGLLGSHSEVGIE
jgi:hypothetical protein